MKFFEKLKEFIKSFDEEQIREDYSEIKEDVDNLIKDLKTNQNELNFKMEKQFPTSDSNREEELKEKFKRKGYISEEYAELIAKRISKEINLVITPLGYDGSHYIFRFTHPDYPDVKYEITSVQKDEKYVWEDILYFEDKLRNGKDYFFKEIKYKNWLNEFEKDFPDWKNYISLYEEGGYNNPYKTKYCISTNLETWCVYFSKIKDKKYYKEYYESVTANFKKSEYKDENGKVTRYIPFAAHSIYQEWEDFHIQVEESNRKIKERSDMIDQICGDLINKTLKDINND